MASHRENLLSLTQHLRQQGKLWNVAQEIIEPYGDEFLIKVTVSYEGETPIMGTDKEGKVILGEPRIAFLEGICKGKVYASWDSNSSTDGLTTHLLMQAFGEGIGSPD